MKTNLFWTLTALALTGTAFGEDFEYPLPPDMPSLDKRLTILEAKVATLEAKCGVTTTGATIPTASAPVTYRQECVNGVCRMVPVTTTAPVATNTCANCICPPGTVCGPGGNCVAGCPGNGVQYSYAAPVQYGYSQPMYSTPMYQPQYFNSAPVRRGLFGGGLFGSGGGGSCGAGGCR